MKKKLKKIFLQKRENGAARRAALAKLRARHRAPCAVQKILRNELASATLPFLQQRCGFDPELLFVECSRCGAPILWESGRATKLLGNAGIDPLELDASCMLLTDACPACSEQKEYIVKIFRVSGNEQPVFPPKMGHA